MDCLRCVDLEQASEFRLSKYIEARSAAYYRVSTELAAKKNVDMERARNDLEEHRLICVSPLRRDRLDQGPSERIPEPLSRLQGQNAAREVASVADDAKSSSRHYSDRGAAPLFVSGAAVRTIFLPERWTAMPGEVFTTDIASVPLA
jgi:hypothetical protein